MEAEGRVKELQARLEAFQAERTVLLQSITDLAKQATQQAAGAAEDAGTAQQQVEALEALVEARAYVARLKDAGEAVRSLERAVRAACEAEPSDAAALSELSGRAAAAYGDARLQCDELSPGRSFEVPAARGGRAGSDGGGSDGDSGDAEASSAGRRDGLAAAAAAAAAPKSAVPDALRQREAGLLERLHGCRDRLWSALSAAAAAQLQRCGWPPPIAGGGGGGGDGGEGGAGPAAGAPAFLGFQGAGADGLRAVLAALTRLQLEAQSAEFEAFAASRQPLAALAAAPRAPLLWAARALAAPVAARLGRLFAAGAPAGRADRPEWLFQTALRLARELGPAAEPLRPAFAAAGVGGRYQPDQELARALRAAVCDLMRSDKLPALAAAGDRRLWLAWADAAAEFEAAFAPLAGAPAPPPAAAGAAPAAPPAALLSDGPLAAACEAREWLGGWLQAEAAEAAAAVEAALFGPGAWDRGPSLAAEDEPAWRCELYPPAAAEALAALLAGQLVPRMRFLPTAEAQDDYFEAAVADALAAARGAALRRLQQAELFKEAKAYDSWAPKMAAPVCLLHFLEYQLSELALPLAAALRGRHEMEERERRLAARRKLETRRQRRRQQQQQQRRAGDSGAGEDEAEAAAPNAEAEAASVADAAARAAAEAARRLLRRPAADYAAARREWVLKVSQMVAAGFNQLAAPYAAGAAAGDFKAAPGGDAPAPGAAGAVDASPALVDALRWLQGALGRLSRELDRDCFRECLRASAAAVNRSLYNDVATEAAFSAAGAARFVADVAAVQRVFAPYAWRAPAAYLPELTDAAALLALEPGAARALREALGAAAAAGGGGPAAGEAEKALRAAGVKALDAEQAAGVLAQRL